MNNPNPEPATEIIAWSRFSSRPFFGEGILCGDDASRPCCVAYPWRADSGEGLPCQLEISPITLCVASALGKLPQTAQADPASAHALQHEA
jgi:hypothetical protein